MRKPTCFREDVQRLLPRSHFVMEKIKLEIKGVKESSTESLIDMSLDAL